MYYEAMRNTFSYLACATLAAFAIPACTVSTSVNTPVVLAVTPSVFDNADGTFTVDLIVDFDDSAGTGDLVDAYTFQTDDGQVNDVDVLLPTAVGSPFTIAGLILPMNEAGMASLGFHLALYGSSSGLGSTFNGTINVH